MAINIVIGETAPHKSTLEEELSEIQALYEYDMQVIADAIKNLEVKRLKAIQQAHIKFNIPMPKKHKKPDMS